MERETDYKSLVSVLRSFEKEEDWFEFKVGNSNPEKIGEYVSALANSAAYSGHQYGYVVWGVDDATHELVGTSFRPSMEKKGNMELRSWLMTKLEPKVEISFIELDVDGHHVAILEVPAAIYCPVRFADTGYIRVGSVTQRLSAHPEIERNLWAMLDMRDVETRMAEENLSGDDLVEKLDFDAYYQYQGLPLPRNRAEWFSSFEREGFIVHNDDGKYGITVFGALLFARKLSLLGAMVKWKGIRVVCYKGNGRLNSIADITFDEGYVMAFGKVVDLISFHLSEGEEIGQGQRVSRISLPLVAVRELLANLLSHQDLAAVDRPPTIEMFDDRLEGTSPGGLLVPQDRILDAPPQTRNKNMVNYLRRIRFCEERGSGFDRIEASMADMCKASAQVVDGGSFTTIRLYKATGYEAWTKEQRLWTLYMAVCMGYISSAPVSNADIRGRMGIRTSSSALVSRLAAESIGQGRIRIQDETAGAKARRYVPYWAECFQFV